MVLTQHQQGNPSMPKAKHAHGDGVGVSEVGWRRCICKADGGWPMGVYLLSLPGKLTWVQPPASGCHLGPLLWITAPKVL